VPAYATTAFFESFDSEAPGLGQTPLRWLVLQGTVDVLNSGEYSVPCVGGTGRCVDLDGSSGQGATLATIQTFDLQPDMLYTLTYYLAGSRWNTPDTVTVSFGGVTQIHQIQNWSPQTKFTLTLTPAAEILGQRIVFSNAGGDNNGAILDHITLDVQTPEPSAGLMLLTGLVGVGVYRIRHRLAPGSGRGGRPRHKVVKSENRLSTQDDFAL
jgi:hypothetical protein